MIRIRPRIAGAAHRPEPGCPRRPRTRFIPVQIDGGHLLSDERGCRLLSQLGLSSRAAACPSQASVCLAARVNLRRPA